MRLLPIPIILHSVNSRGRGLNFWSTAITLLIAVGAAANSVFGFVQAHLFSKHALAIDVAGVHATGDLVKYVIVIDNDGDYPEVVTDATSYLRQVVKGYSGKMLWPMRDCFKPLVIGPGQQKVITYSTMYDTTKPDMFIFPAQEHLFVPSIDFTVRGQPHGVVSKFIDVGLITNGQFTFRTTKVKINFNDARPLVVLGPLPVKAVYATPSLCPSD